MPKPFPIHKPNAHIPAPRPVEDEPQHGDQLELEVEETTEVELIETEEPEED